ncbi:MAG: formate--tetrahydrofolate ligase [Akkermansiaceae bacterium]|nr:formate--tetrahydrofolate ligase [Akkermansiaceae bacterium]
MQKDGEIARAARLRPITEVAAELGVPDHALVAYGRYKAKIESEDAASLAGGVKGRLILVTAMTPTRTGEGKTTLAIGLGDGLNAIGKRTVVCLREPSLGPCFGMKGGATGGGRSQVAPPDDINLHFTGDFHAVAAANNLLAAMVDHHRFRGASPELDPDCITWRRAVDMNDRALRHVTVGQGVREGYSREDGFDIVPASEVMAVLCLARDRAGLEERLARMIVGYTADRQAVTAADLRTHGAMSALLRDALAPNLVQSLENNPVLVHGGPFANIAHGCNSLIATRTALALGDYVVTEAGFGADLGAEKFFNIKCRQGGLTPAAAVIVATVGALKVHGGADRRDLGSENVAAVKAGIPNLVRHMEIVRTFGVPFVVAINRYAGDTGAELAAVQETVEAAGAAAVVSDHWSRGGKGAERLASEVVALAEKRAGGFELLYPDEMPLLEKVEAVSTRIYGANGLAMDDQVRAQFDRLQADGHGHLPVCVAKTPLSLSADPRLKGAPRDFTIPVREVRLSAGAGFVVVLTGKVMTMPGLPRHPAAHHIHVNEKGEIEGLR